MEENNKINAIDSIVNAEVTKEAYKDGLKPIVNGLGNVCGTVLGFVDNVVLYPLKKLSATFEFKAKVFRDELEEKISKIPESKVCEPDLEIVGPALEALKYRLDNDEIRMMFEKLISNNVNLDYKNKTHPRFVEIIKQMNHNDAVIFKNIIDKKTVLCLEPEISAGKGIVIDIPQLISNLNLEIDEYMISASLSNLSNLGLINIDFLKFFEGEDYDECLNNSKAVDAKYKEAINEQKELLEKYKSSGVKSEELYVDDLNQINKKVRQKGAITATDFGLMFADVCLK